MAGIEEMREVSTPLDGDTGDDTTTTDTVDEGTEGGDSGGGEDTPPARPLAARGKDGKFNKPPREQKRGEYRDRSQLSAKLTGVESQVAQLARANEQYQRDIAELRQAAMAGRQQRPADSQPASSPLDQRIKTLKSAIDSEVAAFRNHDPKTMGPYDGSKYEKLKEEYDEARVEAGVLKAMKAAGVDPSQRGRQQPQMTREEAAQQAADVQRRETIYAENPWLREAPAGMDRAKIMTAFTQTIEYLTKVEGRPAFSVNTDREAAAIVAQKLRIPTQRAAPRAARMPLTDNHRGGGDSEPSTFEVPSSQLDGVSPEVARRVAARMARERR